MSKASVSSSSLLGNHSSASGPSPCHLTRYWVPLPLLRSSTIFSMKHSTEPSAVTIAPGRVCSRLGNKVGWMFIVAQFIPPMELDSIPFAALIGGSDQDIPAQVPAPFFPLPKLRYLHLFGVPLNWTGFIHTLGVNNFIQSLELSHHHKRLRPTFDQFSKILEACTLLRRLVIRASGPILHRPYHHHALISLPMLEELHAGYIETDSLDVLLSRLDAPKLVALSIEDVVAIDPRPPREPGRDAGCLLSYCATGLSEHPPAVSRTRMPFPNLQ